MRLLAFCICIFGAAGLVGGAGFASHIERFAIKDVSVSGAQEIPADALTAAVETGLEDNILKIFSRRNIFLYPRGAIEQSLSTLFPRIKDVELSRPALLAQAVVVTVQERQPFAKWCSNDACFLLDEGGFIFAQSESGTPATSYVFYGGLVPDESPVGQFFLQGRFAGIVYFLDSLRGAEHEVKSFRVENEKDFSVTLGNGLVLLFPFDADLEAMLRNLTLALEADAVRGREGELEYVDLRFGNRVYYKFK